MKNSPLVLLGARTTGGHDPAVPLRPPPSAARPPIRRVSATRPRPSRALALLGSMLAIAAAPAHEVHHSITPGSAVIVHLHYADGSPYADQGYELYPGEARLPYQIGRTDADGRAAFLPGSIGAWRLKTYSADGHGMDTRFAVDPSPAADSASGTHNPDRNTRLLVGGALLFGLFGLLQLYLRRSRPR